MVECDTISVELSSWERRNKLDTQLYLYRMEANFDDDFSSITHFMHSSRTIKSPSTSARTSSPYISRNANLASSRPDGCGNAEGLPSIGHDAPGRSFWRDFS